MATEIVDNSSLSFAQEPQQLKRGQETFSKVLTISALKERPSVIVAIPAFNEEIAIGSVVARCLKYVDKVIVVDDGSKDHTAEIAELVGAEVIKHTVNSGYGAAIKTCFEAAKAYDAEAMVIIDADGQHNPDDIPLLIGEMRNNKSDIVIGSRFVNGNGKNQKIPAYRKVGMKVLDTATSVGSGVKVSDSQSGFRLYSRNAIRTISLENQNMAAGSEILIQAADKHLQISEVPIMVRYDIENTSSQNPVHHGFSVLGKIIGLVSERRPLPFFCIPGAVILLAGLVFIILAFNEFNATHSISLLYTIGAVMFIMMGIFSIFTGLILSAIRNIKTQN